MLHITLKRKIKISVDSLVALIPGLFYLSNLLRMTYFSSAPYLLMTVAGGIGIISFFVFRIDRNKAIVGLIAVYVTTLLFNYVAIGNVSINDIVTNVLLLGMTVIMLCHKWTRKSGIIIFGITAAIIIYRIFKLQYRSSILTSSSNYVSIILLIAAGFYYIGLQNENQPIRLVDIVPAGIIFFICLWAKGRGGILVSAVLIVLIIFPYMQNIIKQHNYKSVLLIILILASAGVLIFRGIDLIGEFMSLGKWSTKGAMSIERLILWKDYLSKAADSFLYFLFGVPLDKTPIIQAAGNNCHNSFIQLHAYTGIITLMIIVVTSGRAMVYYIKTKQPITLAILFTFILRGMTDKFIFGQFGMPMFLFLILQPFVSQNRNTLAEEIDS